MPETLNMMKVMAKANAKGTQSRYALPSPALRDGRIRTHVERMLEAGDGQLKFFPQDHFIEHKDKYLLEEKGRSKVYSYMLSAEAAVKGRFSALAVQPTAAAAVRAAYPNLPLLVKLNASITDPEDKRLVPTGTIEDALAVGADAVGLTVYYGTQYLYETTEHLLQVAAGCEEYGIPLIVWNYPRGGKVAKQEETLIHTQFAGACHIMESAAGKVIPILKMKLSSTYSEEDWRSGVYANTELGIPESDDQPMPPNVAKWVNTSRGDLVHKLCDHVQRVFGVVSVMSGGELQDPEGLENDIRDGVGKGRHWGLIVGRSTWGQGTVDKMVEIGNRIAEYMPRIVLQ